MKWEKVEIGKISKVISGYPFKSQDFKPVGTPIVKIKNIKDENIVLNESDCVDSAIEVPIRFHLSKGDILISLTGSHITLPSSVVGRVAKYRHDTNSYLNQRAGKFINIDLEKCIKDYLFYFLIQKETLTRIALKAQGAANQANISPGDVEGVEINLPPLPTQRRIASILSAYDDLIENNLKRIKLLEEKAFLRYKGILKGEKFSMKPFSEVADYINGYPFKPDDLKDVGLPIIKIKELKAGVQDDTPRNDGENIPEKYIIENKDILFAWSASIGAYLWCLGKSILNQHIFNVKPFDKDLHNWIYFSLLEKIPDFINLSNGATMQHIKKSALGMVFLPVPENVICKDFQEETDPIINLIVNLNQQNAKLREARDILLPRLMNGEIVV
jgi:type I restriction enzyme S subunit